MPFNALEYAKLFQTNLDLQVLQQATSGWMEPNAGQVIYNGGDEIKIPDIAMQGLGNYDRDNGFVQGSVSFKYQTHTLTQDRGRTFQLDTMDVNETNFGATAANVLSEFQRVNVIPEIDAYRYSKLAAAATAGGVAKVFAATEATILKELNKDIFALADKGVDVTQLVITMNYKTYAILAGSTELSKSLVVTDFERGNVMTVVQSFQGVPIIPVSSDRMKTLYEVQDGKTAGQEAGGLKPATAAKDINWLITPRTAPIAISKTNPIRIFEPNTNQKADAWKIDYRKYHDIFVTKAQAKVLLVSTAT